MKKIILIIAIVLIGGAWWMFSQEKETPVPSQAYQSEKLGLSFEYPEDYFIYEVENEGGERNYYALVIMEDTSFNRSLVAGEVPETDGPPSITISIYQNNLDNYSASSFVEGTDFSNFKLSDGTTTEVEIDGETGLRYSADGLWQNHNVVIARPDFVYMFTVFFDSSESELISIYEDILESVRFISTPSATDEVKKLAAETYEVSESEVVILNSVEREWPNACLGLPEEDEMCAEVITPGYEVTVSAGGEEYIYHTNADGSEIRQAN